MIGFKYFYLLWYDMVTRRKLLGAFGGGAIIGSSVRSMIVHPNKGVPAYEETQTYTRSIYEDYINIKYRFKQKYAVVDTPEITSEIKIPKKLYNKHSKGSGSYHNEILNSSTDNFVREEISNSFIPDYSDFEVWNIMRFVQNIEYSRDWNTTDVTDYTRHPVETLVDMVGDCKDKTNLMYSILKNRGYNMGYVIYPQHIAPIISKQESILEQDTPISTDSSIPSVNIIHENEKYEYIVLESTFPEQIGDTTYNEENIIYTYTDYDGFSIKNLEAMSEQMKGIIKYYQ